MLLLNAIVNIKLYKIKRFKAVHAFTGFHTAVCQMAITMNAMMFLPDRQFCLCNVDIAVILSCCPTQCNFCQKWP